ncbi:hypothetical protein AARAC_008933 [Aspergillus arachidicola]|uniref:DNA2/NAM7 helicase helicase domain-containing protein n=1 Tax=Aspergillus arachidicola TaxID=656916 RepID=A0A2G7G9Z4_9EURO|nr:hypothetical protein AARAC_008933 [Aspergillus arachidicola]
MRPDLGRLGISDEVFNLLRSSIEGSMKSQDNPSLGRHIIKPLEHAKCLGSSRLEGEGEEMILLWTFLTYQETPVGENSCYWKTLLRMQLKSPVQWQDLERHSCRMTILGPTCTGLDLLCTASTAGRKLRQWLRSSTAIIEEASLLTEPTVINGRALKLGSIKKIILSGDIDQLGPTVPFINANEFYDSENMSPFARLLHLGVPNAQISQQYRMTPQGAELPNEEFYNARLVTASTADTPCRGLQMATSQRYGVQRDDFFMSVMNSNLWSR